MDQENPHSEPLWAGAWEETTVPVPVADIPAVPQPVHRRAAYRRPDPPHACLRCLQRDRHEICRRCPPGQKGRNRSGVMFSSSGLLGQGRTDPAESGRWRGNSVVPTVNSWGDARTAAHSGPRSTALERPSWLDHPHGALL